MFCNQCEETVKGTGCTIKGVCGKEDEIAAYQDVLVYLCKGISVRNLAAMEKGKGNPDVGLFIADALFATLTNVNFDKARFTEFINRAVMMRDALPKSSGIEPDACTWMPKGDADILEKAKSVGILSTANEDVRSLRSTLVFGLKGITAYYTHAAVLGKTDAGITIFLQKGLASTIRDLPVPDMIALVMECGNTGVKVLALLDEANTSAYGKPQITSVKTTVGKRPGILITGHDLKDLEMLLEQSRTPGSMSTPMVRCCRPTLTRHSRSTPTWSAITATPGGTRRRSSSSSTGRSCSRPTASSLRRTLTKAASSQRA